MPIIPGNPNSDNVDTPTRKKRTFFSINIFHPRNYMK